MKASRKLFRLLLISAGVAFSSKEAYAASPPGVPCSARADAVIANTGSIFSDANSLVDSYQSSAGPYGGANVGANGNVQTAATVVANGGVIHGSETQHTPGGLAVVPVPAGATNLPFGSNVPGSLNINDAAQSITLAPGNYVAANMNVNFPGAITISPPGPVLIWVTGNLNLGGNENLNGVPDDLEFLVNSAGSVNVNAGGQLFGFIYAPTSAVNVMSTIFGGVVGSTVYLNSGSAVHFYQNSACQTPEVSVGGGSACAITVNGGVVCWGDNTFGQLGNNSTTGSPVPVPVTGLASGAASVSVGTQSACALTTSGGVLCWGNNVDGQLGDNSTTNSPVPVPVTGLAGGVAAISVGGQAGCAVTTAGGVECWGFGAGPVPAPVPGLTSGVTAVSVGIDDACAVTAGGGVVCWQIGLVPAPATGLASGVTSIAVGASAQCAVASGGVLCSGGNEVGDLGNGLNGFNLTVPVPATGLGSGVVSVSAGLNANSSVCALTATGSVECWGDDQLGNVGNGVAPSTCNPAIANFCSAVPVQVTGLASGVTGVSVGVFSTCAVTADGGIQCWGGNSAGELGDDGVSPNTCFDLLTNNPTPCSFAPVSVVGF